MVADTMTLTERPIVSTNKDDEFAQLQRIARKDHAAFESLYRVYHPKLYRFANGLLNNHAQVEEVVSDTLYAVWTGAAKFKNKSKVSTWIFGIGFRVAMKAVRSNARHSRMTDHNEDGDELVDSRNCNDPSVGAELSEEASKVIAALGKVSPEQRAVVELTALGWSCSEIGEIVGCPTNTVKTRMFNARKRLKAVLDSV